MLHRVEANADGEPITTVVATVSPVWRVIARSTMIEPAVSVEKTAPCRPGGTPTSPAISETTLPAGTVSGSGLTNPAFGSRPRNAALTIASCRRAVVDAVALDHVGGDLAIGEVELIAERRCTQRHREAGAADRGQVFLCPADDDPARACW